MQVTPHGVRNRTPYQHLVPSQVSNTSTSSSVRDLREIMLSWGGSKLANQAYGSSITLASYSSSTLDPSMESLIASQAREIWYRIHTEQGPVHTKHCVDPGDKGLGRVCADWIPRPHTVASIKQYICAEECMGLQPRTHLFSHMSHTPLDDNIILPISEKAGPGSDCKEPLTLVIASGRTYSQGSRSPTAMKRIPSLPQFTIKKKTPRKAVRPLPPTPIPDAAPLVAPNQPERYNRRVRGKFTMEMSDPSWISYKKGEILFTDGLLRATGPNSTAVISVQNIAGRIGYVYAADVALA